MTDFTHDWIAEREQLEQAATEGPWWTTRDWSPADVFAGYGSADDVALATDIEEPADAAFIADARTALPAALAALKAVLELHRLNREDDGPCQGYTDSGYGYLDRWCVECSEQSGLEYGTPWPCPTVRAVEAALRGES